MTPCPVCLNLSPSGAVACEQCGTVLDPGVVPRIAASGGPRTPTLVEPTGMPRPATEQIDLRPTPPPPPPPSRTPATPGRRGQTVFMPYNPGAGTGTAPQPNPGPRSAERRVVAILISYSWSPQGQVFPVREGRNLIGRGEQCDIRVPEDGVMSEVNSHITFRQSFVLGDMVSMSGTDLNGEAVEEQFRPLGNYARIRTGSTNWIFVIADPSLAGVS